MLWPRMEKYTWHSMQKLLVLRIQLPQMVKLDCSSHHIQVSEDIAIEWLSLY